MEGLSLGGLILELGLNLESYEADLQQAKERAIAVAGDIEKSFRQSDLFLKTKVDDLPLTKLNQHLSLKKKHFDEVNRHFKSNPLKPKTDTSELESLAKKLNNLSSQIDRMGDRTVSVRV